MWCLGFRAPLKEIYKGTVERMSKGIGSKGSTRVPFLGIYKGSSKGIHKGSKKFRSLEGSIKVAI